MKKIVLLVSLALLSFFKINGQEINTKKVNYIGYKKGDFYVSGMVNFSSVSRANIENIETNEIVLNFVPSIGYFVNDHLAIEGEFILGYLREKSFFNEDGKTFSLGGGLGVNYHFTPHKKFTFTTGASLNYFKFKSDFTRDFYNTSIEVAPGINYFISKSFSIRGSIAALSYWYSSDIDGVNTANTFVFNLNLSDVVFGLSYRF